MRTSIPGSWLVLLCLLGLLGAGCGGDATDDPTGAKASRGEASGGGDDGSDVPASDPGGGHGGEVARFTIEVSDGQVVGGPQAMPVASGDDVRIEVLTDEAGELHLHGIDEELELEAGAPGVLEFTAKDQGSFELELHDSGLVLGNVQVS